MNIMHISRSMGQGGAQKIVYQLCKDTGSNNKHIVISKGGEYVDKMIKEGIQHIEIPDIASRNPVNIIICILKIFISVIKYDIDIIHSHHRTAALYAKIINLFIPKFLLVYTAHNVFFNRKYIMRFSLRNTAIIAVGMGVKNNLIEIYGIPGEDIKVIYNAVEVPVIKEKNLNSHLKLLNKDNILIGSIGRISKQKGIDIFLKSLSIVMENNEHIFGVIIGDGEDMDEMKKLSHSLKISGRVVFLGYQRYINELISQLDFIVLSSRWEGLPLTPIETFANGKTIIASDISGNNEVVQNEINGLLFEIDNYTDLADKILFLIHNNVLKEELEKRALITFHEKYSYKMFKENYSNLYNSLIQ